MRNWGLRVKFTHQKDLSMFAFSVVDSGPLCHLKFSDLASSDDSHSKSPPSQLQLSRDDICGCGKGRWFCPRAVQPSVSHPRGLGLFPQRNAHFLRPIGREFWACQCSSWWSAFKQTEGIICIIHKKIMKYLDWQSLL